MDITRGELFGGTVEVTAHEDGAGRLLRVRVTTGAANPTPVGVSLVLDRSGSMGGRPLDLAKGAAILFLLSLDVADGVSVVAFDDEVSVLSPGGKFDHGLIQKVNELKSGGSTAIYDGWLAGVKSLLPGGRAILLSDGQANVGRYQTAPELTEQARRTSDRFAVTTSTIGLGDGYDEAVLAGMAEGGGGAHYFASTPEALDSIFSLERDAAADVALVHLAIRLGGETVRMGSVSSQTEAVHVFSIPGLVDLPPVTIRAAGRDGVARVALLAMPNSFGEHPDVVLDGLVVRARHALAEAAVVSSAGAAARAAEELEAVAARLSAHPLADEATVMLVDRLQARAVVLRGLARHFDDTLAASSRKRSFQDRHNVSNPALAYSDDAEDAAFVGETVAKARLLKDAGVALVPFPALLAKAPIASWRAWGAAPVGMRGDGAVLAMRDPRDRFASAEIATALALPIARRVGPITPEVLESLLIA